MGASPGVPKRCHGRIVSESSRQYGWITNFVRSSSSPSLKLPRATHSREDPELGHIDRYLENPADGSVNATVCERWSQDFKIIDGLLFYAEYFTTLGELRVYIPRSFLEAIMKEFHDLPLAGHLGKRKTYLKLRDTCYFPYMRKYIYLNMYQPVTSVKNLITKTRNQLVV
ncbi:hypothetical protein TNCV_2613161 [Trichonephila clavipes]|nr:hypothetical protein TNCV_2613161 [Trichonephila clavipes]